MGVVFKSGKYAGKEIDWVKEKDPSYYKWIAENKPFMLKQPKKQEPNEPPQIQNKLTPNLNFGNEKDE